MPRLDENRCRPGAPLKQMFTADEAAAIKRFINAFQVRTWTGLEPFVDRSHPYGEYTIYIPKTGSGFPGEDVAFGRSPLWRDSGNSNAWTVTIYPGAIRFHGIGVRQMTEEADVALLAETCTVYVQATLANADAPVILVSAVAPESSNTHVRVPLYTYVYDPAKETYAKPFNHHFGDVHFGAPML